jgi:hypothetical protein
MLGTWRTWKRWQIHFSKLIRYSSFEFFNLKQSLKFIKWNWSSAFNFKTSLPYFRQHSKLRIHKNHRIQKHRIYFNNFTIFQLRRELINITIKIQITENSTSFDWPYKKWGDCIIGENCRRFVIEATWESDKHTRKIHIKSENVAAGTIN